MKYCKESGMLDTYKSIPYTYKEFLASNMMYNHLFLVWGNDYPLSLIPSCVAVNFIIGNPESSP